MICSHRTVSNTLKIEKVNIIPFMLQNTKHHLKGFGLPW